MELLKGAAVSAGIRQEVETLIKDLDRTPVLAIVRVGEKPDDLSYERSAVKKMEAFGLKARSYVFDAEISDADFKKAFATAFWCCGRCRSRFGKRTSSG